MKELFLENDDLRLTVLPELGFKIVSVYVKSEAFEALFRKSGKSAYRHAKVGDDFAAYDTSGLDDCLPTIDACRVEEFSLPDHGEVWARQWDVIEGENCLRGSVSLSSMPLTFTRSISLEKNTIRLDYTLENCSERDLPYLWALHGLWRYESDAVLDFAGDFVYENVQNEEIWDFDIRQMTEVPCDHTYKFYLAPSCDRTWGSITYPSQGMRTVISFSADAFPYVGCWITTGGFKGEKNIAIEPTNGYYDALDRCIANEKYDIIEANQKKHWTITVTLESLTEGNA